MATRRAACHCGQLKVSCEGEPVRVSVCHCLGCQRRTGSAFGVQARFRREQVRVEGEASVFARAGEPGASSSFRFCPACGSTVYWEAEALPDVILVSVGAFADPSFALPSVSFYEARRHPWVALPDTVAHEE